VKEKDDMRTLWGSNSKWLLVVISLLAAVLALGPNSTYAKIGLCRGDAMIGLNTGGKIQILIRFDDVPADVHHVLYVVHGPEGISTSRPQVIYSGADLAECIYYTDDQAPGHYSVDTVVKTGQLNVPVLVSVRVRGIGTAKSFGVYHQHVLVTLAS